MTGVRDPKPNSTSWAVGEKLLQAQIVKILENQRVHNAQLFTNMRQMSDVGLNAASEDPIQDIVYSYSNNGGAGVAKWFISATADENSFYQSSSDLDLEGKTWTAMTPGLTASGTINPTRGANKNNISGHHIWWGIARGSATSEGYIKLTGTATWAISNRTAIGTASDDVIGMWYWPEMDTFIASWRYVSNTHRFETNTADAGWVDRSNGLTGDFEVHSAAFSATDFVAIGQSPSGASGTEVSHSTNGTTFTAVTVVSKPWKCIAYDYTEDIWYLLASDWTLYTSTNPSAGFGQATGFTAPSLTGMFGDNTDPPPKMLVQGGVISICGAQLGDGGNDGHAIIVTRDLGTTWQAVTPRSLLPANEAVPIMKILDGRCVASCGWGSSDDGDVLYMGRTGLSRYRITYNGWNQSKFRH